MAGNEQNAVGIKSLGNVVSLNPGRLARPEHSMGTKDALVAGDVDVGLAL